MVGLVGCFSVECSVGAFGVVGVLEVEASQVLFLGFFDFLRGLFYA